MRALLMTVLIAALAVGGYFFYRQSSLSGGGNESKLFAETEPPPALTAEDCTAADAVYEFNDDRRIMLRFRRLPTQPGQDYEVAEFQGRQIGNLAFVVQVTSLQTEYVFTPINSGPSQGPMYNIAVTNLQPPRGAPIAVSLFDSQMHYIGQLPRHDSTAPGYVFLPGMLPILYRDQVDQSPGVFRFQTCETPAPAATP